MENQQTKTLTCKECGKEFIALSRLRKYCTPSCYRKFNLRSYITRREELERVGERRER